MTTLGQRIQNTSLWGGYRVWQRNRDAFFRAWKVEVGGIAIEPFVFLIAIGFGLGSYIQDVDGFTYAEFLAPGAIAGYAMFHATFDSTYGSYLRMETHHVYEAVLFTPLGPADIVWGEVLWAATRGLLSATAVVTVAAAFGLLASPAALLALPAAYCIGLMFAAIAMVMTATATTIGAINNFFTLFILPMFYISGVFFPLEQLPVPAQIIAWALPLASSVALTRGLVAGEFSWMMLVWSGEIFSYGLIAFCLAAVLMKRRLVK